MHLQLPLERHNFVLHLVNYVSHEIGDKFIEFKGKLYLNPNLRATSPLLEISKLFDMKGIDHFQSLFRIIQERKNALKW